MFSHLKTNASCDITITSSFTFGSSTHGFILFFIFPCLAPEAQRETVFVCATCNSSLIKLQWDDLSGWAPLVQLEVWLWALTLWSWSDLSHQAPPSIQVCLLCWTPGTLSRSCQLYPSSATLVGYETSTLVCYIFHVLTLNDELDLPKQCHCVQSIMAPSKTISSLCWAEGGAKHAGWKPGSGRWCWVCFTVLLISPECWFLQLCCSLI